MTASFERTYEVKALAIGLWVTAALLVWLAYTPFAHWVTLKVPYSHFLLVPGGSTAVPVATVFVAAAFFFLRRKHLFASAHKWTLIAIGSLLAAWWVFAMGFYLVIMLRGGL